MREKTIYIAFDDTEHQTQEACKAHEASKILPCKLCGGHGVLSICDGGDTGEGYASVRCSGCGQTVTIEPGHLILKAGQSWYEALATWIRGAGQIVVSRWNYLMR